MTAVLLASLALALAHQPMVHELPRAERATGRTVLCMNGPRLHALAVKWHHPAGGGFWLLDPRGSAYGAILLTNATCYSLKHPARDHWQGGDGDAGMAPLPPITLANSIFMLGHEAAHARQQDLGLPYNEHQANCWSKAGFQRLRHRLGIRLRVTFADAGLTIHC